jgi:hypothetical protein
VVVGVCAGAYHALRLPSRDPRVSGVFAVSPVTLVWRAGDSLAFGRADDGKATRVYFSALRNPRTWRRLLAGAVDIAAIARTAAHRVKSRILGWSGRLRGQSPLAGLRAFARAGGRAHLLMGLDDRSVDEVETHLGWGGEALKRLPGITIEVDPNIDHGLARRDSREIALAALVGWLGLDAP